jgi:hypothetical protein
MAGVERAGISFVGWAMAAYPHLRLLPLGGGGEKRAVIWDGAPDVSMALPVPSPLWGGIGWGSAQNTVPDCSPPPLTLPAFRKAQGVHRSNRATGAICPFGPRFTPTRGREPLLLCRIFVLSSYRRRPVSSKPSGKSGPVTLATHGSGRYRARRVLDPGLRRDDGAWGVSNALPCCIPHLQRLSLGGGRGSPWT